MTNDSVDSTVVIARGATHRGPLVLGGAVRIEGRVQGDVSIGAVLAITESGAVEARIECPRVEIAGYVRGDVVALERLHLRGTAVVEGDVVTRRLVLDEGAVLCGRVRTWPAGRPYLRLIEGAAPAL